MLKIGEGDAMWSMWCSFEGLSWELALCHVWVPSIRGGFSSMVKRSTRTKWE
ncbi:unnamed protein product, partial [Sphenostylis stenocarpa]